MKTYWRQSIWRWTYGTGRWRCSGTPLKGPRHWLSTRCRWPGIPHTPYVRLIHSSFHSQTCHLATSLQRASILESSRSAQSPFSFSIIPPYHLLLISEENTIFSSSYVHVSFLRYVNINWTNVTSCDRTELTYCDLSYLIDDFFMVYKVRVQLVTENSISAWSRWKRFNPRESKSSTAKF